MTSNHWHINLIINHVQYSYSNTCRVQQQWLTVSDRNLLVTGHIIIVNLYHLLRYRNVHRVMCFLVLNNIQYRFKLIMITFSYSWELWPEKVWNYYHRNSLPICHYYSKYGPRATTCFLNRKSSSIHQISSVVVFNSNIFKGFDFDTPHSTLTHSKKFTFIECCTTLQRRTYVRIS